MHHGVPVFFSVSWCWLLAFWRKAVAILCWKDRLGQVQRRDGYDTFLTNHHVGRTEPWWRGFGRSQPSTRILRIFLEQARDSFGRPSALYPVSSRIDEFLRPTFDNNRLYTTLDDDWQASEHTAEKDENKRIKYLQKNRKKTFFFFFWERNCSRA